MHVQSNDGILALVSILRKVEENESGCLGQAKHFESLVKDFEERKLEENEIKHARHQMWQWEEKAKILTEIKKHIERLLIGYDIEISNTHGRDYS
jgi:hypothetical protein